MPILICYCTCPDAASAARIAEALVDERLAACVNVLPQATSFYRWEGRDEQATEFPVLIKTTSERYAALEQAIRKNHPYDLPEIISWPVASGLPAYLDWVEREVGA